VVATKQLDDVFFLNDRDRKRITQSCSELRQHLPTIPGGRVDMVTVLEMTVAYLETIKQVSAHRPDIQVTLRTHTHTHTETVSQSVSQSVYTHKFPSTRSI